MQCSEFQQQNPSSDAEETRSITFGEVPKECFAIFERLPDGEGFIARFQLENACSGSGREFQEA